MALRQPVVAPLYEARDPYWIAQALAGRLGVGDCVGCADMEQAIDQQLAAAGSSRCSLWRPSRGADSTMVIDRLIVRSLAARRSAQPEPLRARRTNSACECTPSLRKISVMWALMVASETSSSPAICLLSSPSAIIISTRNCCGVSDGAACAIVTTPEIGKKLGKKDLVSVKALQLALSSGEEMGFNDWDGDHFMTTTKASKMAYKEAGITDPRKEISMMEVHDCFSITELVTMEDLHISERGQAWRDVLDGVYDIDGEVPCQVDGGLKCFGHPIGASGLRMIYEMYLQLHGRAGERQLENPAFGLTHNLGGFPAMNVCSISIVGKYE